MEMAQEPVYVNAQQYHGILRRRQSRAKAELGKKLIKVRKPYLHESQHQHALRRASGSGGRFAVHTRQRRQVLLQPSRHSPLLHQIPSFCPEAKVTSCNNDVSSSKRQINLSESVYQSHLDKREEGRTSDQQWRNILSNRALAMQ